MLNADLDVDPNTLRTPAERAVHRDVIRAAAAYLAARVEQECTGSGEVVRLSDRALMGLVEHVGHLTNPTGPGGYVAIYVTGRSRSDVVRQILTGVFGDRLDALDIAEHAPDAALKVAAQLRARAAVAGLNPAFMVDSRTGAEWPMMVVACNLVDRAIEQLCGTGRRLTADRLATAAVGLLDPNAFKPAEEPA